MLRFSVLEDLPKNVLEENHVFGIGMEDETPAPLPSVIFLHQFFKRSGVCRRRENVSFETKLFDLGQGEHTSEIVALKAGIFTRRHRPVVIHEFLFVGIQATPPHVVQKIVPDHDFCKSPSKTTASVVGWLHT